MNHSINQSINRSIGRSIDRLIYRSINRDVKFTYPDLTLRFAARSWHVIERFCSLPLTKRSNKNNSNLSWSDFDMFGCLVSGRLVSMFFTVKEC